VNDQVSPLGRLNRFMPKDKGSRRVAEGVPFGPHPRHRLDVYAPVSFDEALPVLNFVYGGGWNSGSRSDYEFAGRAFAAAGFVTVIADYRVVPEVHFPGFLEDGARALNWVRAEVGVFGGDASRQFLMGHSAGAYNAMMLGLAPEEFGSNWEDGALKGIVGLSGPYDFYPFDVAESIAAFSNAPKPEATQPVNRVYSEAPPVFLGHGTSDTICGLYNTQNLADRLRAVGAEVDEQHYEGVKHALPLLALMRFLRWRLPVYKETVRFMKAQLQGDAG
jgi:acetyl esterase/lipase